jgi:hypothetical protein
VSTPDENVARLREAYRQWHDTRGGSSETWLALMTEDVKMRSLGDGAPGVEFARENAGKAAAAGYFAGLAEGWEMDHFTTNEFIAQGDVVVVLSAVAFRHRGTGKLVRSPKADVVRFRDGAIAEFFEFYDTAAILAGTKPD